MMKQENLPPQWKLTSLGEIARITSGGTPDRSKAEYWNGAIPWVKTGEINYNIINETEERITKEGLEHSPAKMIPAGTLLMAMYGQGITRGRVAILGIDAAINQACAAIFTAQEVSSEFLFFNLTYSYESIRNLGHGGNQKNLNSALVKSIPVVLPTLPEQRAIARVLHTLQKAKEIRRKQIQLERELKAALMQRLFTRGARSEARKQTEIGEMPESWQVVRLGEVAAQTQYGLSLRGGSSGSFPILRMNNLGNGVIDLSDLQYVEVDAKTLQSFRLNKGDLLFNRTNSYELVGKTSLFDCDGDFVFASYLVRVVVDADKANPAFLNEYLNASATQGRLKMLASRGVSQANISASKLRGFAVPLPSVSEQDEIARILEACGKVIALLEKESALLDELFRALLEELMTGRLSATALIESE